MSKRKFKVGDRVRIREWADMEKEFGLDPWNAIDCEFAFVPEMKHLCGRTATVAKGRSGDIILDCDNKCDEMDWYISADMLEKIETEKVVIYRNGSKVVAKNTYNKIEGVAICSPEDEFDFYTGAKLALSRVEEKEQGEKIKSLDEKLNKIKVGDTVEVINNGACYTTYKPWFDDFHPELSTRYVFGHGAEERKKYEVVAMHEHHFDGDMVYAISKGEFGGVYLIGENGIEKE